MADLCDDGRFELIEKYKLMLMESTNISDSEDELKVLDTILFRFWQMGWLDKLEQANAQPESCGDVISREYLKEHIEACWINGRPRYAPELNELLSWIDDVPSAQQWIPCSERLPEEGKDVLCCFYNGEHYRIIVSHRTDFNFWSGVGRTGDLTAWKPLPEPWKGEQE